MNNFYKHIFRSSRLQMFFKISALKNFAILKKETPTQVFSCKKLLHDVNILIYIFTKHLSLATFFLWILLLRTAQNSFVIEHLQKQSFADVLQNGRFLNVLETSQHLSWSLFLKNFQAEGLQLYQKDSNAGVFPWSFWNF